MLYGSSHNMEAAQSQYMKAYSEVISKPFSKAHDFPHTLSEEGEKEKEELEKINRKPVYFYNFIIFSLKMTLKEQNYTV